MVSAAAKWPDVEKGEWKSFVVWLIWRGRGSDTLRRQQKESVTTTSLTIHIKRQPPSSPPPLLLLLLLLLWHVLSLNQKFRVSTAAAAAVIAAASHFFLSLGTNAAVAAVGKTFLQDESSQVDKTFQCNSHHQNTAA